MTVPARAFGPVSTSGPVTGGNGQANAASAELLGTAGYVEEEYFFEGDAATYTLDSERTPDWMWTAAPGAPAPFRSRMIVRRPTEPDAFSGVAVVEWLNVTAGSDGTPDWEYTDAELIRKGHAWVGVSAQRVGVVGGEGVLSSASSIADAAAGGLVGGDRDRYGSLFHPGDAYSFDIYNQAAAALLDADGPAPLGGLAASTVIAVGESQSATFLATYVNAVHPITRLFDGFLVHSRLGTAAPLGDAPFGRGEPILIRTDLAAPVLQFATETDLTVLGFLGARQPDTEHLVTWEVAGTAHADRYLLSRAFGRADIEPATVLGCPLPVNDGPHHQTIKAALHHLIEWVVAGISPPRGDEIEAETAADGRVVLRRDELGNVLGGIRTPPVDVPISALSGELVPGARDLCSLLGSTRAFDPPALAVLYPTTDAYLEAYSASLAEAVTAGHILQPEADAMLRAARSSNIRG
jgi:alpha/beta hydrolase family protein